MGVRSALKGLVIMLPFFISILGVFMNLSINYNFTAQKTCSPQGVPEDVNSFICNDKDLDLVNDITTTTSALRTTCSAVSSSIFGFIRDLTGKNKPLMLIGVIAELINFSTYFTTTLYWSSSPWIHSLVYAFVSGGFGDPIMQLGATCLLIQTSAPEELPLRMQIFMNSILVFIVAGGALATVIITSFGYQWLFSLIFTLQAISLILLIILVKEKETVTKSFKNSLQVLKNLFKWRENIIVLWLMLFAGPIMLSTLTVEATNTSSFLQMKFQFSMYQATSYGCYSITIAIVGSMIASAVLMKAFHCSELMTGIIASVMNIVGGIVLAYIETPLGLYLCTLLNFMRLVTFPLPNTIIGKIVSHEELGTYLGFAAVITSWIPLTITKLYRIVFQSTTTTEYRWEGAFYIVSSGIFGVLAIIYSLGYYFFDESKTIEAIAKSQEKIDQNIENGKDSLPDKTDISMS